MKKWLYVLAILAAVMAWRDWIRGPIEHPPGVLVPQAPIQGSEDRGAPLMLGAFTLTPRAEFQLRARVLGRKDYRWGAVSELSPMDLALGWRAMSDQAVLDRIEVRQGARWYFTRYELPAPLSDREIVLNSGNMHMIPATDRIRSDLRRIRNGDVVRIEGFLVDVDRADGFRWRTSLTREDTGDGSCEIVYLERLYIERRP